MAHPEVSEEGAEDICPAKAPDGGWGWMVVLGCTLMHSVIAGLGKSFAVIFLELQRRFHSSAAITAWVGGLAIAVRMTLSPLGTGLSNRFGTRGVSFLGGILIGVGCCLSAFTPNTEFMFFSFSFLTGLGGALVHAPAVVLVNHYFDKRRSFAAGVATAGAGLGSLAYPPVVALLFMHYGFGAMLLLGALSLHLCVSASLYRPLEKTCDARLKTDGQKIAFASPEEDNEEENAPSKQSTQNPKDTDEPVAKVCCPKARNLNKYLDFSLLKDPLFLTFAISQGMSTTSYIGGNMLLLALAEERGVPESKGVFMLSSIGLADTFGRLSCGYLFDRTIIRRHRVAVYNAFMFITAMTYVGWVFAQTFLLLTLVGVVHGYSSGAVVSQKSVIASQILGLQRLSSSFGLTVCFQGCGNIIGPFLAGYLRDKTESYLASYLFCAITTTAASLIFLSGRIFRSES